MVLAPSSHSFVLNMCLKLPVKSPKSTNHKSSSAHSHYQMHFLFWENFYFILDFMYLFEREIERARAHMSMRRVRLEGETDPP